MSERKQLVILVLLCFFIWFIGLVVLSDENVNNAGYFYYRFKHGSVIRLDGRCFQVPDKWVIGKEDLHPATNIRVATLAESYQGEFRAASIFLDPENKFYPVEKSKRIAHVDSDIEIYELLISGGRILFWAKDSSGKTISASNLNIVEYLMKETGEVTCR